MINTDKYEGHTPADAWRHADGSVNYMPPMNYTADVELITDAPLLLEEVKRLREQLGRYTQFVLWVEEEHNEVFDEYEGKDEL